MRLTDFEPVRLDELSPATLASYKKKAGAAATAADAAGDIKTGNKRFSGIVKATKKQFDQDAKGVTEGEKSPMVKDSQKADRIRSLKNLIAIAREQGRQLRVQELELELKKLQGVTEMDKSSPQPGRDGRVSHSTYGSRDKGGSKGTEREARPITAKKAAQHALDILKKQGVAEGSVAEDSLAGMKRLAGIAPVPTPATPGQRQYRHMPTAVQPR
jgi:hypothetical protein